LSIRDFDRGVVETLGGELVDLEIDGQTRQAYAVKVPNLYEYPDSEGFTEDLRPLPAYPTGYVPIFFMHPEEVFQPFILPCIVVRRSDFTPNFSRAPYWNYCRVPAPDANPIYVEIGGKIVQGWDKYITREGDRPYDIGYEVHTMARLMNDELRIFTQVLKITRDHWFSVFVKNSTGESGSYRAGPVSISDQSELVDVSDRTLSHMIGFDVWAFLTLSDDVVSGPGDIVTAIPEITFRPFWSANNPRPHVMRKLC
jgi:hypothetical protein